jgi:DNA adenine methylase
VLDEEALLVASEALGGAETAACDFESAVTTASRRDVVYFDPPYTLAHNENGFVRYNQRLFSWPDQLRLAQCAQALAAQGVCVIVSNASHQSVLRLYPDFQRITLKRESLMAADPRSRKTVSEIILTANL